jgi:mycothione reductase
LGRIVIKKYDLIAIGTGSAMNIVDTVLQMEPDTEVAVIDKDDPGGICLTRGCIPTKLLIYPADMVRMVEEASRLGVKADIRKIDFKWIMKRMRTVIRRDMENIRQSLMETKNVDYFPATAEFVAPYRLKVGQEEITSKMIFLCLGSRPSTPPIKGLERTEYFTSDTVLDIEDLPPRIAILGGGYIAAEYGHFFSAMGSKVTIVGRNPRFLPDEEPEISRLAQHSMSRNMDILTNHEVIEVSKNRSGGKEIVARNRSTSEDRKISADEILLAVGRAPNTDLLHPEKSGIELEGEGWVKVNEYLETTKSNIWALGDANGKYLFKHVANYESKVVFYNAIMGEKMRVDYHAVPHAVFSHPEIASVGLKEREASKIYGEEGILIGLQRYEDTARGEAMGVKDYFVKVIVEEETRKILGAHIIGPHASVLIQEIVNLMYTADQSLSPITEGMHIHPALNEVVDRAFTSLMPLEHYRHLWREGM